jgi:DNA repair protein RecO (recombination protein O)
VLSAAKCRGYNRHVGRIRLYRTDAVVLGRRDYGEADRILTLYTPERGKITAIAKGVRRLTSRQCGQVELFSLAHVLLAEGRSMDVVTQAEMVEPFAGLRGDLGRTTYAYHVAETTDRFIGEGSGSPATFRLLLDTLAALAGAPEPAMVARYFELRLLDLLGYRPELRACPCCGGTLTPDARRLGLQAGGVLCRDCEDADPSAIGLSSAAFRVLRFLQTHDWADVRRLEVSAATCAELENLMTAVLRHHLERDLKSMEFIRRLREIDERVTSAAEPAESTVSDGAGPD